MAGGVGLTGGLTNPPAPGAEDAESVILISVGLPCLERGRLHKKRSLICINHERKHAAERILSMMVS